MTWIPDELFDKRLPMIKNWSAWTCFDKVPDKDGKLVPRRKNYEQRSEEAEHCREQLQKILDNNLSILLSPKVPIYIEGAIDGRYVSIKLIALQCMRNRKIVFGNINAGRLRLCGGDIRDDHAKNDHYFELSNAGATNNTTTRANSCSKDEYNCGIDVFFCRCASYND
ncbi:hypothetical protein IKF15_01660 [Candidatus Saccharibacteria bacterium]|nr:hypothetical protein [Candidatus Saccharibacteria bacterium]